MAYNKHIIFIRSAHWDAYSLAGASRKFSQQVCAPYVKRYYASILRSLHVIKYS